MEDASDAVQYRETVDLSRLIGVKDHDSTLRDAGACASSLYEMERDGGKSWRDTRLKVAVDWMEEHLLKGLRKENQAHLDGLARAAANAPSLAF